MKPLRLLALAAVLAATAACSERHVVRADSTLMVVMEDLDRGADPVTASVLYVMAEPTSMGGPERMTEMIHAMAFDCASGKSAERETAVTLTDGRVISTKQVQLDWDAPTPDTLGAALLATACDPAVAKRNSSRNSTATMRRTYREQMEKRS